MNIRHIIAIGAFAMLAASCSDGGNDTAVPRRKAYPRVEPYDTAYTLRQLPSVAFDANTHAAFTVKDSTEPGVSGADITYDRYGMTVYVTAIRSSRRDFDRRLDDRIERVSLNLGGARPTTTDIKSDGGFDATIFVCPGINTPVQALAADSVTSTIVSATLFSDAATAAADSVAPMLDIITRDITRMMQSLSPRP